MNLRLVLSTACALAFSVLIASVPVTAAPQLQQGAVVNAASFLVDGAPGSAIAQGSLFTVFGVGVGPQDAVRADSFPLPLDLGGVKIKITANGQDHDAVILFAISSQVSAILPSNVATGEASLVLTYNGEASNAITFQVVAHQAGVFSRSQTGTGLAVLQNYVSPDIQPTNTLNQAAQPGQVAILWGTGLGASSNADDRNAPATGDLVPLDQIKVYVGGKEADVQYAGRSGCCSGVDQINFVVPSGVDGCFVPVVVAIDGSASNFTAMSINSDGPVCDDPYGLNPQQIETLLTKETIRTGVIALNRNQSQFTAFGVTIDSTSDVGVATFKEFRSSGLLDTTGIVGSPVFVTGSCTVTSFRNDSESEEQPTPPAFEDIFLNRGLDAGAVINVSGPNGPRQLPKDTEVSGDYFALLTDPMNPLDTYLGPGGYSFNNGAGGADVKAFSFSENVASFFSWTNKASVSSVQRNQGLTVTWTPGGNPNGVAAIFGTSYSIPRRVASAMFCFADPQAGTFTIPPYVLNAMVKSESTADVNIPAGSLSVGGFSEVSSFTAEGLDVGAFVASSLELKILNFD